MLKIIGLIMIIGSCSGIGLSMNRGLDRRIAALKGFIWALQVIKAEIVFRALPLEEILQTIGRQGQGVAARFFDTAACEMAERGESFWQTVEPRLAQLRTAGMKETDVGHLSAALHALGRYDAHEQAEIITASLRELEGELEAARADKSQKGRLYRAMGVTAGIAIALIII